MARSPWHQQPASSKGVTAVELVSATARFAPQERSADKFLQKDCGLFARCGCSHQSVVVKQAQE